MGKNQKSGMGTGMGMGIPAGMGNSPSPLQPYLCVNIDLVPRFIVALGFRLFLCTVPVRDGQGLTPGGGI